MKARRISYELIDKSVEKILKLKERFHASLLPTVEPEDLHRVIKTPEHEELAMRAASLALTVVQRDSYFMAELWQRKICVISPQLVKENIVQTPLLTMGISSTARFVDGLNPSEEEIADVRECAKFLPSRSRRFILKNFEEVEKFVQRCEKSASQNKRIKTHLREIVIVPKLVGMTIGIHNGKNFQDVLILSEMIGHRLGEFSMTTSKVNHGTAGIGATKGSKALKK